MAEPLKGGWQQLSDELDLSPSRDAHYEAASWALGRLEDQLGADWLERAIGLKGEDDPFPLGLHALSFHTHALAEALEWALRLDACKTWRGSADFMRDLVRNPHPSRIMHSRSQLSQASCAERLGWPVALEPASDSGSPADLAIQAPSGSLIAEIRVLLPSEFGKDQRQVAQAVTDWLFELGLANGVWIGGHVSRDPTTDERHDFEEFLRREKPHIDAGEVARFTRPDILLEVSERSANASGLTSPPVREDLFTRMVRAITEKAERMQKSGAQWLHVNVLTGLWAFTEWGRGQLEQKLPEMSAALTAALGQSCPEGIILTSAASLAPEDFEDEIVHSQGGIGLRIGVPPLRARESVILPLRQSAAQASTDWLAIANAEQGWLDWALARRGLPSLSEMLNRRQN